MAMNPVVGFFRAMAGKIVVPRLEKKFQQFVGRLERARTVQRALLFCKLKRCARSQFGRDHHFGSIKNIEDFRKQIPIAQYDYYYPYIKQVTEGNVAAMFPEGERLLMYTLSSGTTDEPKLIPINPIWMKEYRRGWHLWGIKAFLDHHPLFYARLAGIAGNWDMRRTPTDIPCGMASGLSARLQSPLVKMAYCIPPSVFEIADASAKYYTALRLAVPERVGLFLTATPATVVNFAKLGDRYRESLIRDVHDGTISSAFDVPDAVRKELRRRTSKPNPARAKELEEVIARTGKLHPKDYWDLSLVACWLGGTVGSYARHIRDYYGEVACRDIGLLCSEGRFTVPIEDNTPGGVLEIDSHYYEFIPEDEIDSPNPTVLECHELEVGKDYFILLTTSSGLYRYNIYDVMQCTGYVGETPILEFRNKGQRFSDMEGEKISEFHFVKAVTDVSSRLGLHITGFTAVPVRPSENDGDGVQRGPTLDAPYYAILAEEQDFTDDEATERFLLGVDEWLSENNVMYQGKRADHYIGPPRLLRIRSGSFSEYDRSEVLRRGVGEDHYKHPCLVVDSSFIDRFEILSAVSPRVGAGK